MIKIVIGFVALVFIGLVMYNFTMQEKSNDTKKLILSKNLESIEKNPFVTKAVTKQKKKQPIQNSKKEDELAGFSDEYNENENLTSDSPISDKAWGEIEKNTIVSTTENNNISINMSQDFTTREENISYSTTKNLSSAESLSKSEFDEIENTMMLKTVSNTVQDFNYHDDLATLAD